MDTTKQFELHLPVRVLFGSGGLDRVGAEAANHGQRAAILTMPELVRVGFVERARRSLSAAGCEVEVFDALEVEPSCVGVDALAAQLRAFDPHVLVALGGGSVMDAAKAVAIRYTHPEPSWMYVNLSNRPPLPLERAPLPVIAVPTTAGTGAEVTPYAVLSNPETVQKGTIKNPGIFPKTAIVDPDLTVTLPWEISAGTAVDAFAHALESFLNVTNRTPFSDLVAREAMRLIYESLPQLASNPDSRELRTRLAWASTLAGVAIANAGTTVAHALAQPFGIRAHAPHAIAVAIFTVPVLRHTWDADVPRFAELAGILEPGTSSNGSRAHAERSVSMIDDLLGKVGMRRRMSEFNAPGDVAQLVLEDVFSYMSRPLAQHPRKFTRDDITAILQEAA